MDEDIGIDVGVVRVWLKVDKTFVDEEESPEIVRSDEEALIS